jgi:hypothetical protein
VTNRHHAAQLLNKFPRPLTHAPIILDCCRNRAAIMRRCSLRRN